jgi:DNA invertase Pin-like site-specific DNA recombinase
MDVIGYARISSLTQNLDLQVSEIEKFVANRGDRLVKVFTDTISGRDLDRPGFMDMINFIDILSTTDKESMIKFMESRGEIDIKSLAIDFSNIRGLVIYKIDRVGRNVKDLMNIIEYLEEKNIQLISITENIDASTSQGMLAIQMLAAYAEYERNVILERTQMGRELAKLNPKVQFGRPRTIIDMSNVSKDLALGIPKSEICKRLGIKRSTLYNKLKEERNYDEKMREERKRNESGEL